MHNLFMYTNIFPGAHKQTNKKLESGPEEAIQEEADASMPVPIAEPGQFPDKSFFLLLHNFLIFFLYFYCNIFFVYLCNIV